MKSFEERKLDRQILELKKFTNRAVKDSIIFSGLLLLSCILIVLLTDIYNVLIFGATVWGIEIVGLLIILRKYLYKCKNVDVSIWDEII